VFISKHTVEHHLPKVFAKLGINTWAKVERAPPDTADRFAESKSIDRTVLVNT
jgi:hypothetical protein